MKRLKTLFLLMLTCLMLVQLVPFSAAAETTSDLSAVLSPHFPRLGIGTQARRGTQRRLVHVPHQRRCSR